METTSFYITLPSNASMDYYPTNKASCYQIRLPRTLYLKGKYEVALAEIQYPHTWTTTRGKIGFMIIRDNIHYTVNIPQGYYSNIDELIDFINTKICDVLDVTKNDTPIKLATNKFTRKTHLRIAEGCFIQFSPGLADILGFKERISYSETMSSPFPTNLKLGFYTLFVYCSICEPQVVGDYYVPLLRSVAIEGNDGDIVMKTYGEPHYVPVNTSKFDTIEINIKDDLGENVTFETGKVICKLHFRHKAL